MSEVTYGNATLAGSLDVHTSADTGTTLIHPRATVYSGKIQLPRSSVLTLQPLTFMIKYKPLTLPPKQYMLTDDEVDVVGGDPNKAHLWIAENTGNFDVTFELKVLGQFYSVHDGDNHCVGLHQ
ncbi:hypothetical protein BGZ93_008508 [Podila epicladia]|nr:hypothetical protein BGZ93_008508 [Podila epicladia]